MPRLAGVMLVATLLAAPAAMAAGQADAARGIVSEHCAKCHAVPDFSATSAIVEAPAFTTIAQDRQTYSEARIRKSLLKPHFPMTGITLSPSDIDNLVAYFAALGRS